MRPKLTGQPVPTGQPWWLRQRHCPVGAASRVSVGQWRVLAAVLDKAGCAGRALCIAADIRDGRCRAGGEGQRKDEVFQDHFLRRSGLSVCGSVGNPCLIAHSTHQLEVLSLSFRRGMAGGWRHPEIPKVFMPGNRASPAIAASGLPRSSGGACARAGMPKPAGGGVMGPPPATPFAGQSTGQAFGPGASIWPSVSRTGPACRNIRGAGPEKAGVPVQEIVVKADAGGRFPGLRVWLEGNPACRCLRRDAVRVVAPEAAPPAELQSDLDRSLAITI